MSARRGPRRPGRARPARAPSAPRMRPRGIGRASRVQGTGRCASATGQPELGVVPPSDGPLRWRHASASVTCAHEEGTMAQRRAPLPMTRIVRIGAGAVLAATTALGAAAPGVALAASTLQVPSAYPTIQAAIDAAVDGDTVLVAPGTFRERIDFLHKDITVESSGGRDVTTIDAGGLGAVVKMATDPGETPTLRGFTITGGGDGVSDDGGIDVSGGPALIEDNLVTGNTFCDGGGIEADFSSAAIRHNTITNNRQTSCSGGSGGGGVSIG